MTQKRLLKQLEHGRIVPVVAIDRVEWALPLADALIAGGLPIAEVTFRTNVAAEAIRLLASERPELIVGAGTVLSRDQVDAAFACGACFAVSPGCKETVVQHAQWSNMPFYPGVATPTEVGHAIDMACPILKYFPAEALGGVAMLKAMLGPYRHTGVRFIPTGGINENNLSDYLAVPEVIAVGGTWLARKEDMMAGNWEAITQRCRQALALVRDTRDASVP